jgi:hypothetical protein
MLRPPAAVGGYSYSGSREQPQQPLGYGAHQAPWGAHTYDPTRTAQYGNQYQPLQLAPPPAPPSHSRAVTSATSAIEKARMALAKTKYSSGGQPAQGSNIGGPYVRVTTSGASQWS